MRYLPIVYGVLALILTQSAKADIPEVLACADKTDPGARLACYDAAVAKFKTQVTEEETKEQTFFGFKIPFTGSNDADSAPKLGPKPVNQVDAKIAGITVSVIGHKIVTLDNGQVWRVDDYRQVPMPEGTQTRVQIVRNVMGGFYMGVDGDNNDLLVTRIK